MTSQQIGAWDEQFRARLVHHVAARLGCAVTFLRFDEDRRTHASIPIFGVPADRLADARALGLHAEAVA